MLLFILATIVKTGLEDKFQNISCYCLSHSENVFPLDLLYFKTSHVIVYQIVYDPEIRSGIISKHLMLLFIAHLYVIAGHGAGFQNISCYCLSMLNNETDARKIDFKTSHVIVYRKLYPVHPWNKLISKHLMLLFIGFFQIFLQNQTHISKHLMLLFIRSTLLYIIVPLFNFKTSHVIVYPFAIPLLHLIQDFKTSHVIVYLHLCFQTTSALKISKHLMLLFISFLPWNPFDDIRISKHLMLLFISNQN